MLLGLLVLVVTVAPPRWYIQQLARPWDDPKGNVLIVLGGQGVGENMMGQNSFWRTFSAVLAWREGGFHYVVVTGTFDVSGPMRDFLVSQGVPAAAVIIEGKANSTRENALFSIPVIRTLPGPYVLMTSDYHIWRAHRVFTRAGLQVLPRPIPDAGKRIGQWTARWPVFLELLVETTKIGYYWARGWI